MQAFAVKEEVLKMAAQSDALVYSIGVFPEDHADGNPRVLRELARSSGGQHPAICRIAAIGRSGQKREVQILES